MLNSLFPDISWTQIKCVGFDLDGTLYDEFASIQQVYRAILRQESHYFSDFVPAYTFMLSRWLEKGSSYNSIFGETFELFSTNQEHKEEFVHNALALFRSYSPELILPNRNHYLLNAFAQDFDLFLISDGPPVLQRNKFRTLGLNEFFAANQVIFTGDYGKEYYKPRTDSFHKLAQTLGWAYSHEEILYFGDRGIDEEFSCNLNIHFQKVYNMVPR